MTRADWKLPPVDGIPGYLAATHARWRENRPAPTPYVEPSNEPQDSLPCVECAGEVPATFEADPDNDYGGAMRAETICDECGEPWCTRCSLKSDTGHCAACTAETDETPRVPNLRACQQPLGSIPEPEQ